MSHIKIRGGHSLHGEIEVQGAKNAALPIIAASVSSSPLPTDNGCASYAAYSSAVGCPDYVG